MEPRKKLTRDQTLIQLVREAEQVDSRMEEVEDDHRDLTRRVKKLEQELLKLAQTVRETDRQNRLLRNKLTSLENDNNQLKTALRERSSKR